MKTTNKTKPQVLRVDEIMRFIPELGFRLDGARDDGSAALWFRSELETRLAEIYETERPEYQFAMGEILPIRGTIPARDGEIGYYHMWDHRGVAKWASTKSDTDIPTVAVERSKHTFTVHMAWLGWEIGMADIERARERLGESLEIHHMDAAAEGLDSMSDDVGFSGDSSKGIVGFTNIPNMSVLFAAAGAGGVYRWSTTSGTPKTAIEAKQDIDRMRRVLRAVTHLKHDITHVWVPPSFWERTTSLFISGTAKTLREHLMESYPGVIWKEVRRLESAGTYGGPCIMAARLTSPKDCWIEQPGHLVPGLTERVRETIRGYFKSWFGGVVCVYPLRFVRMDFAAD